ncbi:hypothetical protein [Teredinibacter franksiae]|uniref:hypothetical protein n=1 Tax=Teredinibacter franksiae TaxID=2761453 RepID=UPI00162A3AF5|nr:hypothetical protein [Teredinibacter franksiae]
MKYFICTLFAIVFASSSVHAIILDFDEPLVGFQTSYGDGDAFSEDGFSLTNHSDKYGSFIRFNPNNQNAIVPNNGTTHVGITLGGGPILTRDNGGVFSFVSLDIAEYSEHVMFIDTFNLAGYQADGGVLLAELSIDKILDDAGGHDDFQSYLLNWKNLTSVEFLSSGVAFDNVIVNTVTEPSTVYLLLFSMVAVLIWRKKNIA